ncbi:hypothetical protein CONLIGDRAFT_322879 [Coniochaeta ligniaria NRRL 30616]|uniref:Uncharacterized protein n=1 Tax=Coniochaeta ligniaria NRRL 30616 TaxID=1408157 RepID=A0A1J7IP32_9PEZI|nr:hypothetical protein CONLIGDRAFT_322879 [Coniochaeta ligniaria NRRL 30616]
MPRRVHLPADGLICLLVAASIAGFWVGLYDDGYWYTPSPAGWYFDKGKTSQYIVVSVFLVILLLIHAVFFCFLLCSRQFRKNRHIPTPRIMYLPDTGEAVVVLSRPYPPEPSHQQPQIPSPLPAVELAPLPVTDGDANLPSPVPLQPTPVAEPRATHSPTAGPPQVPTLALGSGWKGSSLQTMPPRKPLPGPKSTGTHYATPWPPDHVPDEAERARAARGESQAQWMTLAESALELGKQTGNPVTGDPAREGEKSDLFRGTGVSTARKP